MIQQYANEQAENYAIMFASWILDNGFRPSDEFAHKWMKFADDRFDSMKHYTERQMLKMYKKAMVKKEVVCKHKYVPDTACGHSITVCRKCGDVI